MSTPRRPPAHSLWHATHKLALGCVLFASNLVRAAQTSDGVPFDVVVRKTRFEPREISLLWGQSVRFINRDDATYTVESPGGFSGDLTLPPKSELIVRPKPTAEEFTAMIEEFPASELHAQIGLAPAGAGLDADESPFDAARRLGRQPLVFPPGREPELVCYTRFNLKVSGEDARQNALKLLFRLEEDLSEDTPPPEVRIYFTNSQWQRAKSSIAMVYGLGPGAYDAKRFGSDVAQSKPAALHKVPFYGRVHLFEGAGQSDVLVRVTSNSYWLNLRICRAVWSRLRGMIDRPTLDTGYANPNGRSPLLTGFFDGTGNPTGASLEKAVYAPGHNGTTLAWLKIRFDEERFERDSLAAQEQIIGRHRRSGLPLRPDAANAHKTRAQNDGKTSILRMPFVFDGGPGDEGMLFSSAQASLTDQFERIFVGYMLRPDRKGAIDRLLGYMKFDAVGYYAIPASPPGSYPGSLRYRE